MISEVTGSQVYVNVMAAVMVNARAFSMNMCGGLCNNLREGRYSGMEDVGR